MQIPDAAKARQIAGSGGQSPILNLKKLEWDKKGAKVAAKDPHNGHARLNQDVVVSNNVVIIATTTCCILRWNAMDASREPERIDVPIMPGVSKPGAIDTGDTIDQVFIDTTANHVIIGMKSMDNYYLHSRSQKPKKRTSLQGVLEKRGVVCSEVYFQATVRGCDETLLGG
jgi:hypothetical protein